MFNAQRHQTSEVVSKTVVAQGFSPASGSPKGLRYSVETGLGIDH
jgi:hypothetical protein